MASGTEDVELGVHENHVIFSAGDVWLTSRRIDGQFPNYKQLLPETFEVEIAVPREALLEVVRRAGLMAQRNAPLRLRFADGELTVSAQTQDVGEATRVAPGRVLGRGARDRVQPRLPPRRPRGGVRARRFSSSSSIRCARVSSPRRTRASGT